VTGKEFLECDYNRDGSSFRSPWSNEYQPKTDGFKPSDQLVLLEQACNEAFAIYMGLYFNGGISSVYFWDLDQGFACSVLLKKGLF
jgi:capping protein beta